MTVLDKLSTSLNRKDQNPNKTLAKNIAAKNDKKAVKELVDNLSNKKQSIRGDCIKTLYEIGEIKPKLLADFAKEFIALLDSKNNRMQWGAMSAIETLTPDNPKPVYAALPKIVDAADKGTVITRDNAVKILVKLCAFKEYYKNSFPLLIEQILNSPTNQLPMYAELAMPIINEKNKEQFIGVLESRFEEIPQDTKRKRVEKVIKKITKNG